MARYMRTDLGRGHSKLSPPAVVGAGIAWHGPGVYLTAISQGESRIRRRGTSYALRPPQVVTAAVVQIFFGPQVAYRVAVQVPQSAALTRRSPTSRLSAPSITGSTGPSLYSLAASRRGRPKSFLRPPTATIGLEDQGKVSVHLSPSRRGIPKSRLYPPAVVGAVVETGVFYGPQATLAPSPKPRVRSTYVYPIVVFGPTEAWGYVAIQYVRRPRPKTTSKLFPPVIAEAVAEVFYGPKVKLTRNRPPQTRFRLAAPTVVGAGIAWHGPGVYLTRSKQPPTVIRRLTAIAGAQVVVAAFYGPELTLARARRPVAKSVLRPPAILASNLPTSVTLASSSRGKARYRLSSPTVVFLAVEIYGPEVHLSRIRPRPTTTALRPPTDVLDAHELALGPDVHTTYSRRGAPKSILQPPAVVAPVVSYGPEAYLAPSFRGTPKSRLKPPTVVASPPAYVQVMPPALAYSRRGRPVYFLNPPTRVFPFLARKIDITLAPQRRGRPISFLSPPAILKTRGVLQITLAPQRRGQSKSFLRKPVVVRLAVEIYGPKTWLTRIKPVPTTTFLRKPTDVSDEQDIGTLKTHLAYSRRGRPVYRLEPPVVTAREPFRGLLVHLTYSRRPKPFTFRIPERPGVAPHRGIQVHLTRITPRPTTVFLKPPTVVGAGVAFYGPEVHLVRIRPPRVMHLLRLTLVSFRRPQGDVCGFDIAGSFVCSLEVPGALASGSDSADHAASGTSQAGSTVTGSDSAGGSVSGSDRKAT